MLLYSIKPQEVCVSLNTVYGTIHEDLSSSPSYCWQHVLIYVSFTCNCCKYIPLFSLILNAVHKHIIQSLHKLKSCKSHTKLDTSEKNIIFISSSLIHNCLLSPPPTPTPNPNTYTCNINYPISKCYTHLSINSNIQWESFLVFLTLPCWIIEMDLSIFLSGLYHWLFIEEFTKNKTAE